MEDQDQRASEQEEIVATSRLRFPTLFLTSFLSALGGFLLCYFLFVPSIDQVNEGGKDEEIVRQEPIGDTFRDLQEDTVWGGEEDPPDSLPQPELPDPGEPSADGLLIPVLGVQPDQLYDSYSDSRSEGRVHEAIDIPAPEGTPVIAAISGKIVKLFLSEKGGITLYQRGEDGRIYYYAHLGGYASGMEEGKEVSGGEVIGYVGNTGNAGPDNYHLHFAIWIPEDSTKYWDGQSVNPYPLLRSSATPG